MLSILYNKGQIKVEHKQRRSKEEKEENFSIKPRMHKNDYSK